MSKRRVCVVITARPSYSRVRSLLHAVKEHDDLELQLVVAASALLDRYGATKKTIQEEGFEVDRSVYMILEGENLVTSASPPASVSSSWPLSLTACAPTSWSASPTASRPWPRRSPPATCIFLSLTFRGERSPARSTRRCGTRSPSWPTSTSSPPSRQPSACDAWASAQKRSTSPAAHRSTSRSRRSRRRAEFDVYESYRGVGPKVPLDDGFVVVLQHP